MDRARSLPLVTLLSQALVAFTIEFDNEFERQMPHRTTNHGSSASGWAPWLVSLAMWENCMRFIPGEGVTLGTLEGLARTPTNLPGMTRWGYVVIAADAGDRRKKPARSSDLIRATPAGRKAQDIWRPLSGEIEQRWETRFGKAAVRRLRESLEKLVSRIDAELPDCLPILHYGLTSNGPDPRRTARVKRDAGTEGRLALHALLSRLLLVFAVEFERESDISLAICANLVRVLDDHGIRVRDLPALTGVSREALAMAMGILQKKRAIAIGSDAGVSRTRVVRLTAKGREIQREYRARVQQLEADWRTRFGEPALSALRQSLEALVEPSAAELSPLFRGLEPYPDGWRASLPRPEVLPHYPMVLHRGGFPDGS